MRRIIAIGPAIASICLSATRNLKMYFSPTAPSINKLKHLLLKAALGIIMAAAIPVAPATAQESLGEAEELDLSVVENGNQPSATRAFDHYVVRGGWITWFFLIPLSVTAVALMIDFALTIRRKTVVPQESVDRLESLLEQRAYNEAAKFASEDSSVISYVMLCGLVEAKNGYAAMHRAMEDALEERAARFNRRIEYLNILGAVSPMIGLFGTVNGIIGMFVSISETGGIPVLSRISNDLGSALVATFWGLLIAIPALTVFGLMRNRIESLTEECAIQAEKLTALLLAHGHSKHRAATQPAHALSEHAAHPIEAAAS